MGVGRGAPDHALIARAECCNASHGIELRPLGLSRSTARHLCIHHPVLLRSHLRTQPRCMCPALLGAPDCRARTRGLRPWPRYTALESGGRGKMHRPKTHA